MKEKSPGIVPLEVEVKAHEVVAGAEVQVEIAHEMGKIIDVVITVPAEVVVEAEIIEIVNIGRKVEVEVEDVVADFDLDLHPPLKLLSIPER